MNPAWWATFGPAEAQIRCGDAEHRLRWADGGLQAVDHPDAEGELVLGALGGDTSPCLDLVMAWGKHCDDLTVLAIGPRSASDRLTIPASLLDETPAVRSGGGLVHGWASPVAQLGSSGGAFIVRQRRTATSASGTIYGFHAGKPGRVASHRGSFDRDWIRQMLTRLRAHGSVLAREVRQSALQRATASWLPRPAKVPRRGWSGSAPAGWHRRPVAGLVSAWHGHPGWRGREVDETRADLIRLLTLGSPFQFRLSAAVAHAWSADGANAGRSERARPALTAALAGRLAPAAAQWLGIDPEDVEVSVHDGDGWGELALDEADAAGRLQARLPLGWLASVWAAGFAVVDGHLVVSVLDAAWPTARVLAVRSPGREPAELTIRDDGAHWSVTSR